EGDVHLEKLIKDIIRYHQKYGYAVVIVSEGVKIKRDFAKNRQILEEALNKDSVAKAAFEAGEADLDAFGHPKLKYASLIIASVLKTHLEKVGISISNSLPSISVSAVESGRIDAQSTQRVLIVETAERDAASVARLGAEAGATRTLIPEEADLDLEELANDLINYHKEHGYAVLIVSKGFKINKSFANNGRILEEALAKDKVARDAFEYAEADYAGLIITAVLQEPLKKAGISISTSLTDKLDYLYRSANTSEVDLTMCSLLGRAAIEYLMQGRPNLILYVEKDGKVDSIPLTEKLGGRQVDYQGKDREEYLKANLALIGEKEPGAATLTKREITSSVLWA
ncbi:MAG: 6-phosphofructokinase, partial [Chloroflexota bacterium]|nr:6-phosphofructokinase [Chloroflexota bacterium]